MEYIAVKEAAQKWGISIRRVQYLCKHNMIPNTVHFGKAWSIPKESEKPMDGRCKAQKEKKKNIEQSLNHINVSKKMFENKEIFEKIVKSFPFPIHVFTPNGTSAMVNKAFLKVFKVPKESSIIGRYNVLNDPDNENWGIKDYILRGFKGEVVQLDDIKVPVQTLIDSYSDKELLFERIYQNISIFPINDEHNKLEYIVSVFITSRYYHDREEIMRAKEYIEDHWLDEFYIDKVAGVVNLSKYHFIRLFKKHTGYTPYGYYQNIKINKLKERLCNVNLSISQAFADCGVDYNGNFAKIFKEKVGMTPSQYRTFTTKK